MEIIKLILNLTGSIGFLLYGMKLMSDGIQKSAGEKLQRTLSVITGNRIIGLLTGLIVTMIIQSSGATTVMVVTFVNAGLLTLTQSVGVIFGANIGTTITAWIVSIFSFSFKISAFAIPIVGIGYFLSIIKKRNYGNIGEALMGFGMLFLGLSMLSDVISLDGGDLSWLNSIQGYGFLSIIMGFLVGVFITALLHSSSAFSAIVITMALNGLVTWEFSAALTLGSNIGSTIDAILASIGSNTDAKRASLIHVLFNVAGTILALIFFKPFLDLVILLTPGHMDANIAIKISMFHTVFKTLSTIILLPQQSLLIKITEKMIPDRNTDSQKGFVLDFQEHMGKDSPAAYIIRAEKAVADMSDIVSSMFDKIQIGITERNSSYIEKYKPEATKEEDYVDQMHEQITHYLIECESLPITAKQRNHISNLIQIVDELENMSDNCFSTVLLIIKSIEKKMSFKDEDMERLLPYIELAREFLQFIRININQHLTKEKQDFAVELENQIDTFRKSLKKIARKRLEKGENVKAELLYIDFVRKIENIGDNCFSISSALTNE